VATTIAIPLTSPSEVITNIFEALDRKAYMGAAIFPTHVMVFFVLKRRRSHFVFPGDFTPRGAFPPKFRLGARLIFVLARVQSSVNFAQWSIRVINVLALNK